MWLNLPGLWSHSNSNNMLFFFFLIQLARDLLHPSLEEEKKKHKKKRLVQSPNSYFMDVKCPGEISNLIPFPRKISVGVASVVCIFSYIRILCRVEAGLQNWTFSQ